MFRLLLFLTLAGLATTALAERLTITPKHAGFAPAIAVSTVRHRYEITNTSDVQVTIRSWQAVSEAGTVEGLPRSLSPGESETFEVVLPLEQGIGKQGYRFALFTDETDVERYRFTLSGFVFSLISPERPMVNFGMKPVTSGAVREVTLSARETTPLVLEHIVSQPDWIDAEIDGSTVRFRTHKAPMEGIHAGTVRVATNLDAQPFVDIPVRAILGGPLRPSAFVVGFKPVEVGESVRADIDLHYSGKGRLSNLDIDVPDGWTARRLACPGQETRDPTCIRISLTKTLDSKGQVSDQFIFRMPGEAELSIPFGTIALSKGQTIRQMVVGDDVGGGEELFDLSKKLTSWTKATVESAPASPVDKRDNVARARGAGPVHIHWTAGNEARAFGYMVYRSTDRAGPFMRVSERPIKTHDAGSSDAQYSFTDSDVEAGATYYYYIDTVMDDGSVVRLSPVLSKTVTPAAGQ